MMEFSLTHGEPIIKNDNNYINLDYLRVKKVNRTHHLLIGNITMHVNQGNDYEFFGVLYKKQGNTYKKSPYKMGPKKFCDFLREDKMFYPSLHHASDFPSIQTCPWPSVTILLQYFIRIYIKCLFLECLQCFWLYHTTYIVTANIFIW